MMTVYVKSERYFGVQMFLSMKKSANNTLLTLETKDKKNVDIWIEELLAD